MKYTGGVSSPTDITLEYQQTPNMWQINDVSIGRKDKLKTVGDSLTQCPKPFVY